MQAPHRPPAVQHPGGLQPDLRLGQDRFDDLAHLVVVGGELRPSNETSEPQWVSPTVVPDLQMHPPMRQRVQHYLDKLPQPYLG